MSLSLRPYQLEAVERAREVLRAGKRRVLIVAPTGCHAKGQRILTYMGGFIRVERVRVGQKLWGHDGQARTVLQLCRGRGEMFEVSPNSGGKPFVVNLDHIMVLAIDGHVVDISLRDWFKLPGRVRAKSELVRLPMSGVARSTFRITPLGEDDYYGFTLDGDGRYVLDDYTVTHNSGKTVVAAHIIHSAAERGKRVLFVAHRRELINQSYNKLLEAGLAPEQLGVIMASDKRRNPGAVVQVASVDTLRNRAKPRADIVFVDEAHRATAQSYVSLQTDYPEGVHLGLTATPYRADGRGLGECYDEIVQVASPKELIEMGFLVEPSVLTVPADKLPDLSGVKTSRGDYDATQLEAVVNRAPLVGSIIEHWLQYANGVPTVAFATSVEHSKSIAARFCEAGIAAEHLDGTTPQDERDAILARLERGEIKVLANMGVLCEGWDQPAVKCCILARPTKSTGLYLQQAGRILRPYQGQRAIILDHAGNARMHGLPQQDRESTLEAKDKRSRSASPPTKTCPSCYAVLEGGFRTCPHCGLEFLVVSERAEPEEVDGKLVVMKDDSTERRAFYDKLVAKAKRSNRKPGWAAHKYRERYGTWPPFAWREKQPPRLDATLDEMQAEYEHLREIAEERGYKPGYVAIRFQEKFGRQIPYSAFDNRGREAQG